MLKIGLSPWQIVQGVTVRVPGTGVGSTSSRKSGRGKASQKEAFAVSAVILTYSFRTENWPPSPVLLLRQPPVHRSRPPPVRGRGRGDLSAIHSYKPEHYPETVLLRRPSIQFSPFFPEYPKYPNKPPQAG